MKTSRIVVLMILVTAIAMAAPASAYFSSQSLETKAERMVEVTDGALDRIMDLVEVVEADTDAMDLIIAAGLDEQFYDNVSLCVEEGTSVGGELTTEKGTGWTYLDAAKQALLATEYEDAIDNAREALTVFRDVLRSMYAILLEAGVETEQIVAPEVISDAIDRSLDRIEELRNLLSEEAEVVSKLDAAEILLNDAKDWLEQDDIENAKDSLKKANDLISEVCQYLKEVAQELNPQRIRDYCEGAYQYRERFGHAWNEEFDVNGFLQTFGYQNEDEFMNRFQEMIENARDSDDFEDALHDLDEIGRMIRGMDEAFAQEIGQHRARHGQSGGSGYMQGGSGFGGMDGGGTP